MCKICDMSILKISHIASLKYSQIKYPRIQLKYKNRNTKWISRINDIKEHKVREASRNFKEKNIRTLVMHFDIFNGQVAFVDISEIPSDDVHWITRQQMEGQSVFNRAKLF